MPPRRIINVPAPRQTQVATKTKFISSGSHMFDLMLGGGWALGRIANLVGDKSSGKTLLAIEACANFALHHDPKWIRYAEAEAAFDEVYAESIGMPRGVVFAKLPDGNTMQTVEQFYVDLENFLKSVPAGQPCMYVLDSLDSLSDTAEMARTIDQASYGAEKAKAMSKLFRQLTSMIESSNCFLLVISQIRDKIGVTFGETKTRSGGRALDFYASQIVWLAELQKITRVAKGVERKVGTKVLCRNKKNKVGMPYREVEVSILFNYGVDDEESMLAWISKHAAERYLPDKMTVKEVRKIVADARTGADRETLREVNKMLRDSTTEHWMDVENALKPTLSKY